MSHSLQALAHTGFQVGPWDDDAFSVANRGTQLFAECEVGLIKASALINRANLFFGMHWKAVEKPFTTDTMVSLLFLNSFRLNNVFHLIKQN